MFADSFLPNLMLFIAGQAAAWYWLRTGRPWLGGLVMAVLWIAADWALVARYAYDVRGGDLAAPLAAMQVMTVIACAWLLVALWRRRWSKTAKQRTALFAGAQACDLAGARDEAVLGFRRLLRCDPWDAAAWVALGNTLRSDGQQAKAARCYRRAKLVDRRGEYTELCDLSLRAAGKKVAKHTPVTGGTAVGDPVTGPRPARPARAAHPARS